MVGLGLRLNLNNFRSSAATSSTPQIVAGAVSDVNIGNLASWVDGSAVSDSTGNNNGVTAVNPPGMTTTVYRGQRQAVFDGVNDYFTYGKSSVGNTGLFAGSTDRWTIFLFNVRPDANNGTIFAKSGATLGTATQIFIGSQSSGDNTIGVRIRNGSVTTIKASASGTTSTVALRYDGTTVKAYIMSEGETAWTEFTPAIGSLAAQTSHMILGARNAGGTGWFPGRLSRNLIYDFDLTDAQMSQMAAYTAYHYTNKQFDAKFIFFGSSIEAQVFGTVDAGGGGPSKFATSMGLLYSKYVSSESYAVPGWTSSQIAADIDSKIALHSVQPYPTYGVLGGGGNDVTNAYNTYGDYASVPQGPKDALNDNFVYSANAIVAKGFTPILIEIPYRLYSDNPAEDNGVKPYNDNIITPLINTYSPNFMYDATKSYYEIYKAMLDNWNNAAGSYFEEDKLHPNNAGEDFSNLFFCQTIGKKIFTDTAPTPL